MPNFQVLDARIASALNKIIHNSHFRRRISLEEQKPRKRTVSFAADRLPIWYPPDDILEGLYKLRIREFDKLKTALELYDLETHQKKLGLDNHNLTTMAKRSIEQEIWNENFGNRNGNFEKNALVQNQGTKQRVQRIFGDCWQWEANGQCVKGDNCSFRHDMNKRGKSHTIKSVPNSFMRQSERKSSRTRSPRGRSPSGWTSRWPCKDYLTGTCNNPFFEKWHPPECLFYKTKSGCRFGEKCAFAHRPVDDQPTKRSKTNNDKRVVAVLKKGSAIGFRFSAHDAAEVFSPEGHRHAEANPTCEVHKGYCASHQNSRPKSFVWLHLSRWISWA